MRRRKDTKTVAIFTSFWLQAALDTGTCSPTSSACLPARLCRDQHNVEQPSEWAALLPEPSMCTKTSCCCSLPSPNKLRQTHKISLNTKESRHAYRSAHLAVRKEKAVLPMKHQTYLTSSEVLKGLKVTPLKWIFLLAPCCFIFKSPSLPAALPSFISC